MSQENLELVRRFYEQGFLDRADYDTFLELAAPDVEFVNPEEAIDGGVKRGQREVWQAIQNGLNTFESSRNELHELFEAGDTVVASVSFHARSRGSDVEITQEEAHTWTFRDGLIVRFEWGRDLPAARDAAGV